MRIVLSLIVAILLFAAVGTIRYNSVVSEDDRVAQSRRAGCERLAQASTGDPLGNGRLASLDACNERAHQTTMAERSLAHYFFSAWLWGLLAGLIGGFVTFSVVGRRRREHE